MPDISSYNAIAVGNIASINGQDISSGGGAYNPVTDSGTYTETVPTSGLLKMGGVRCADNATNTSVDNSENIPKFGYGSQPVVNLSSDKDGRYVRVVESKSDFVQISYGRYGGFGITASGQLWEQGSSASYISGSVVSGFTQVTGVGDSDTGWTKISSSSGGALAINSGKLYHIGQNTYGNAGTGNQTASYGSFSQVGSDSDWVDVARGSFHSMAVKGANKVLYTTGRNANYRTGLGTSSGNTTSWTQVDDTNFTNTNVSYIHVNSDGGLFIRENGEAYGFGDDDSNERFGTNTSSDIQIPTQLGKVGGSYQTDWVTGAMASNTTYLINTSGKLYFAGEGNGRRGDGTSVDAKNGEYVQIGSYTDWVRVTTDDSGQNNQDYSHVGQRGNRLYYWGSNQYSGILNNTLSSYTTAVDIMGQDLDTGNLWGLFPNQGSPTKMMVVARD